MSCIACSNALKRSNIEQRQQRECCDDGGKLLMRLNAILDAVEGQSNGGQEKQCVVAHVKTLRSLLKNAASCSTCEELLKPGETRLRSEHCNKCRHLLRKHIPQLWNASLTKKEEVREGKELEKTTASVENAAGDDFPKLLTFESFKTFIEWSCVRGESMRRNDASTYDDVFRAFQWCAREEIDTERCAVTTRKNAGDCRNLLKML